MTDVSRTVEAVWKLESGRIVGGLTRIVGDVGLAQELAQDALVAALDQWPRDGVPDNPAAWLTTVAKRRTVDHLRRARRLDPLDDEGGGHDVADEQEQPDPGRGRLSYPRAEYLFKQATKPLDPAGVGFTLRRLRAVRRPR